MLPGPHVIFPKKRIRSAVLSCFSGSSVIFWVTAAIPGTFPASAAVLTYNSRRKASGDTRTSLYRAVPGV